MSGIKVTGIILGLLVLSLNSWAQDAQSIRATDLRLRMIMGRDLPNDLSPYEQEVVRQQADRLRTLPKSKIDFKEQKFGIKEAKAPIITGVDGREEEHYKTPTITEAEPKTAVNVLGSAKPFGTLPTSDKALVGTKNYPVSSINSESQIQLRLREVMTKQRNPYR